MKGDFSRHTFDPARHYAAVLQQQGRVQLDADWNEQQLIALHRDETTARDLVGLTGAPRVEPGFLVTATGANLAISRGHFYVDGILSENGQDNLLITEQPDLPGFALPTTDGVYLAYLEAWQRHESAAEQPNLREKALGGSDTTTRLRSVAQVRLLHLNQTGLNATCGGNLPEWNALLAQRAPIPASAGRLQARTAPEGVTSDPACVLPPSAGFKGLENQLYRVEIHTGGDRNAARFKWSRENGSVVTAITDIAGLVLTVETTGRDDKLAFTGNQWVEVSDDALDLARQRGELFQIGQIDPANRTITLLAGPLPALDPLHHRVLRRWEQRNPEATNAGLPLNLADWITLEDGIQVHFEPGTYKAGDFWLIPARSSVSIETGTIEWPRDAASQPAALVSQGNQHHFARLGVFRRQGGNWTSLSSATADCRTVFPPLTQITAQDVAFDNTTCDFDPAARTVQEALDQLCQRSCCSLMAAPGSNLQELFNRIDPGQDAHVCLSAGTYVLSAPVNISGKGHLRITGAGASTRILAMSNEAALIVQNCRQVVVEDLYAETGAPGVSGLQNHLNGTLTFLNCQAVTVESVGLRCGPGPERHAACLTVRDERPQTIQGLSRCAVRVWHCDLEVGYQQAGVLLVDAGRSVVEDNFIRVAPRPSNLTLAALAVNRRLRARVRGLMFSNARLGSAPAGSPPGTVTVIIAGQTVSFRTDPAIVNAWQPLLTANPPPAGTTGSALLQHVGGIADRIILTAGGLPNSEAFRLWFQTVAAQEDPTVASQGIVVGGRNAPDVRIKNNNIDGVLQGIHIGVSHQEPAPGAADVAGTVSIADNRIRILLSPLAERERHGIFVGNCDTLFIENNHAVVVRFGNTTSVPIDGVLVHGVLGLMMIVRQNHVANFTVGVRVAPLFRPPTNRALFQWLVAQNMMPNSTQTVIAPAQVRRLENIA